jgi:hypothetical protein
MANELLTQSEVIDSMMAEIWKLSPAEQSLFAYSLQISMGGFPRDAEYEARLRAALEEECNSSQRL